MDEKNYLWLRFFARTFDALLYIFLLRKFSTIFSFAITYYIFYFINM